MSISNTIKNFDTLLGKSNKNVKFEFNNSEKYFVVGDRIRIKQVVSNLIHNSIKPISRENDKKKKVGFL
jgi:C4-dicarboxylate-specific signal transduction histidine kinase